MMIVYSIVILLVFASLVWATFRAGARFNRAIHESRDDLHRIAQSQRRRWDQW